MKHLKDVIANAIKDHKPENGPIEVAVYKAVRDILANKFQPAFASNDPNVEMVAKHIWEQIMPGDQARKEKIVQTIKSEFAV